MFKCVENIQYTRESNIVVKMEDKVLEILISSKFAHLTTCFVKNIEFIIKYVKVNKGKRF